MLHTEQKQKKSNKNSERRRCLEFSNLHQQKIVFQYCSPLICTLFNFTRHHYRIRPYSNLYYKDSPEPSSGVEIIISKRFGLQDASNNAVNESTVGYQSLNFMNNIWVTFFLQNYKAVNNGKT